MDRRLKSFLSLCQRAGKIVTGEDTVEINIKKGAVYLCLIAGDASDNTKNKFINKCTHYNIPYCVCFTKEELSSCIGKFNRSVYGITDSNFADKMRLELSDMM